MNYQTFPPSVELDNLIKCYWTLESTGEIILEKQRIVPDGCMEMIFHYGDLYKQYREDGSHFIQPRCFVFGQITTPLEIAPTGKTGIFSVRFHPNGFLLFAMLPVTSMNNRAVPLQELFGTEGLELEFAILPAPNTFDRIAIIETFLQDRLMQPENVDRIISESVALILNLDGRLSIDQLTQEINISRRQLERKFAAVIGLSPKQLSKIIRLQGTLKLLLHKEQKDLTSIAYESEYYDQSHFIKDFKEFTGVSPKQFYADNLQLSTLFYSQD